MNPNQPYPGNSQLPPQQVPMPQNPPQPVPPMPPVAQPGQFPLGGQPVASPQMSSGVPSPSEQLASVATAAQEVLCRAKTVFPFVLFPDTIIVDREKVTINHTSFFKSGDTESIHLGDVLNVTANVGPLFGSLKLTLRNVPPTNPHEIKYLHRRDVIRIKNIMQGCIIARQNNIDTGSMPKEQLVETMQQLGGGQYRPAS